MQRIRSPVVRKQVEIEKYANQELASPLLVAFGDKISFSENVISESSGIKSAFQKM